ncbi:hypothetical protein OHB26_24750 [Nocardia sp. NBC_01503]|uniref:hypothetical protein n=1 Tax=Nocardia sp. NBC_01503 TaxID=2975997 RepID=UPI002E7AD02C|nr:hypothetical protein [Nocardia sp. NBC_01503]WTL30150.1 hypothetical protein OHB26_24750 [Nocardia sp. NBC_01503]
MVTTVSAQDTRGDLEIRWDHNCEGISACLTVQEARLLHRQLTVLLGEFTGIDNEVEDQEPVNDDGVSWPAPEWVRQALKHGFPSRSERVDSRENHSGTTGPEGVK